MNEMTARLLNVLGAQLPALAALIPIPGIGIVAALGQALLGNPHATAEQVTKHIENNPEQSKDALQPLEEHATSVASAAVSAVSTVPTAQLPAVTEAMTDTVAFVTDDRPFALSVIDHDGGATLSMYMNKKELEAFKTAVR